MTKPIHSLKRWLIILSGIFLFLEIGVRVYVELPLKTDFYGSISREKVGELQEKNGLKTAQGLGWAHLGWIADPENETEPITAPSTANTVTTSP